MLDAYMYTGLRSPFGRHAGALARLRPDDMLAGVIAKVVAESGFAADKIEDVVVGCANQGGEDSRCVARHAALVAGLPIEIPGSVLQRNCGSGLNAIGAALGMPVPVRAGLMPVIVRVVLHHAAALFAAKLPR